MDEPQQDVAQACTRMSTAGTGAYDGCFLDVLGWGPLVGDYLETMPVHADGAEWTKGDWLDYAVPLEQVVAATGLPLTGNGLGNSVRYFDPDVGTSELVPPLDAAMPEIFLREPKDPAVGDNQTPERWLSELDMITDIQGKGKAAITTTKMWGGGTETDIDRWHRFTLASFMQVTNGSSMMAFLRGKEPGDAMMDHPYNSIDIGSAGTDMISVGSGYKRYFTGGLAIVNPSDTAVRRRHGDGQVRPCAARRTAPQEAVN